LAALGERLKNDIGSAPVVWFRSADPKSDLPLMQAFFGAITPSNLFGVWKIVLESEELYPARVIDALEAAIEYRVNNIDYDLIYRVDKLEGEWVRHATKTFPVLPIRRKLEAIDLITALGDDPQFLWSLDFRRQGDIEELIGLVPRSLSEGLLIDFAPGFDEELLFECVGEIIRKRGGYSRNLLFRNGLLQHAYDWRLKTTPFKLPERVLSAEGGEIRGVGDFDRERDAVRIGEWVEALLLREQRARADAGFIIAPPGSAAAAAERPQASPMGIDVQGVGYTARR
ncbi:MAG: hypothetical protein ACE5GW_12725, partial [Planctomycetota bacterium]